MDNGADSYCRFLAGDDDGIVEIIRDYKDGLILFLNRYVHNIHTAEDLAEDTFFRIVVKKPRFDPKHSFKTWLYTIGRNIAFNYIKQTGKVIGVSADEFETVRSDEKLLESAYIQSEEAQIIHNAMKKINTDYEQVLFLKFFEELSNEEIAIIMKKTKRQIENLIYQAKRSLRSELEKEGFDYEEL